jgi:hypothetical protein
MSDFKVKIIIAFSNKADESFDITKSKKYEAILSIF